MGSNDYLLWLESVLGYSEEERIFRKDDLFDFRIFSSPQEIMDALEEAVELFGANHVFSNVIIGLGESDQSLRQGIDELIDMGVLPILRAAYPHPLRRGEVDIVRPSADRLLGLARYLRMKLDEKGLDGSLALTGCYRCTGCDLAPGRDL